uniref:Defensin-like protein 3 n=1 Tax=Manduca sexta TaxID=7130 RepID=D1KRL3_MANSE|nr:defensin-like protein 3 [Manduca sexta]
MNTKLIIFLATLVILTDAYVVKSPKDLSSADSNALEKNSQSLLHATYDESLYIPMRVSSCSDGICDLGCKILGYPHGRCISANTCQCY